MSVWLCVSAYTYVRMSVFSFVVWRGIGYPLMHLGYPWFDSSRIHVCTYLMHIIDKGMFVYSRMPAHPHYCTHTFLQTGHATNAHRHTRIGAPILRIRFDVHDENLWLAKTEAKSYILKRRADSKLNENN